jgi:glycosyltransferase involved in cell wall biosynthesis
VYRKAPEGRLRLQAGTDERRRVTPKVTVVIPALNEAANLPYVLTRIPEWVHEVILVDGHSTDGTVEVARSIMPTIRVVEQRGRGKGDALACGFAAAGGDIIVMLDADGSTDPGEIPRFVTALENGADFVKGSRYLDGGGSDDLTPVRTLGNKLLAGLVNAVYKTRHSDLCYGYMAFWRRCIDCLHPDCAGFEVETLLTIRAARNGLSVAEVPSHESPRLFGESRLHVVRDGLRIVRVIVRERYRDGGDRGAVPELVSAPRLSDAAAPNL